MERLKVISSVLMLWSLVGLVATEETWQVFYLLVNAIAGVLLILIALEAFPQQKKPNH